MNSANRDIHEILAVLAANFSLVYFQQALEVNLVQYLHAALVLHSSGKKITEKGIGAIIKAAGDNPDDGKIKALVATLESLDIEEVLKSASMMPVGVPAAGAGPTEQAGQEAAVEEEAEEEEEGDDLGLSSLFG